MAWLDVKKRGPSDETDETDETDEMRDATDEDVTGRAPSTPQAGS
jgi:hypothetical protein